MPISSFIDEFDTSSNKQAMSGRSIASSSMPPDPVEGDSTQTPTVGPMSDEELLTFYKAAYAQGRTYQQTVLQSKWQNAYAAYNNQHFRGSKYTSPRYRGRSKFHRPKTRAAVRRKAAEAAAALFATAEVVIISAEDEGNQQQRAAAAVNHELLNYRLDRTGANGIPWFVICSAAHQTGQITGICISKQYWEYKEKIIGEEVTEQIERDPLTGAETIVGETKTPMIKVVKDRPQIRLYPPEDVIRDNSGNWVEQAQESSFVILRNPMTLNDARQFLKQADKDGNPMFLPLSEEELVGLLSARTSNDTSDNTRRARETTGIDRYSDANVERELQTIWFHENFFRINDEEWHFWTVEDRKIVSPVRRLVDVYPEQRGERPIAIGFGALDAFKIDPMSSVEAWGPIQQEINDTINLRLDVMKQTVSPVTKVRRGRNINLKEIQNRGPDSVVYVDQMDDVEFDQPGQIGQGAFIEMERLNADFDELAGTFSVGSVQTNRELGDTVGGMTLINNQANAMGEFDLKIWIETWVEPTLRQLINLEQFYETDEKVLAIAGQRAQLRDKYGMDQVTDELLSQQVNCRVNVGLGAADPMMKLQKLTLAAQGLIGLVPTAQPRLKADELIAEFFGAAGFRDPERFFYPGDDQDPRIQEMTGTIQQLTGALEDKQAERDNQIKVAQVKAVGDVIKSHLDHRQGLEKSRQDAALQMQMGEMQSQRDEFAANEEAKRQEHSANNELLRNEWTAERDTDRQGHLATQQQMMDQASEERQQLGGSMDGLAKMLEGMAKAIMAMAQMQQAGMQQQSEQMEQFAQAIVESTENQQQSMEALAKTIVASNGESMDKLGKIMSAPRKVIRNKEGFADSVVTEQQNG